jgi:hypothetical protein
MAQRADQEASGLAASLSAALELSFTRRSVAAHARQNAIMSRAASGVDPATVGGECLTFGGSCTHAPGSGRAATGAARAACIERTSARASRRCSSARRARARASRTTTSETWVLAALYALDMNGAARSLVAVVTHVVTVLGSRNAMAFATELSTGVFNRVRRGHLLPVATAQSTEDAGNDRRVQQRNLTNETVNTRRSPHGWDDSRLLDGTYHRHRRCMLEQRVPPGAVPHQSSSFDDFTQECSDYVPVAVRFGLGVDRD